jgi:hypothetical protein
MTGDQGGVDREDSIVRPICTTNGRISALIRINPPLHNGSREIKPKKEPERMH